MADLISQIDGIEPNGEIYNAKVKVLSEYVKHHVKEEEKRNVLPCEEAQARHPRVG